MVAGNQVRAAGSGGGNASKWAAFSKHMRTSSSGAFAYLPVCPKIKK
jgi:hypothetical protein